MLRRLFILLAALALLEPASAQEVWRYEPVSGALNNPLDGCAVWAEDLSESPQPFSLVYANITWAELEPREGEYDFASIEARCHFAHWRERGKHIILRFVMDVPGKEEHCDLPFWLMERVQGAPYQISYGRGWCPDYVDEALMAAHRKAVAALGARYDADPFVSFVELGSLGHWGEWHVREEAGAMPGPEIRLAYARDYLDAFSQTLLLARRPFREAAETGLGLYNDASGDIDSTLQWLDWIENGGEYAGEKGGLAPMPEAWKRAPIGGELTTEIEPEDLLRRGTGALIRLFRLSHTSWIGPNSFSVVEDVALQGALDEVMANVGSRVWVSESRWEEGQFTFVLENDGVAPFYYPWPVRLRVSFASGEAREVETGVDLRAVLPGERVETAVAVGLDDWQSVEIGVIDPMTGLPALRLAMEVPLRGGWQLLAERSDDGRP